MDVAYTKRRQLHTDSYIWKKMIAVSRRSRMACFACVALVAVYLFVRDLLLYAYHNHKRVLATGLAVCLIIVSSFSVGPKQVYADETGEQSVNVEPVNIEPLVQPQPEPENTQGVPEAEGEEAETPPQLNIVLEPKLPQPEDPLPDEGAEGAVDVPETGESSENVNENNSWDDNETYPSAYITLSNLTESTLSNINIQSDRFDIVIDNGNYQLVVRPTDENGDPIPPGEEDLEQDPDEDTPMNQDFVALIGTGDDDKSCKIEISLPEHMTWAEFKQLMVEASIIDADGNLQFQIEGMEEPEDSESGEGDQNPDSDLSAGEGDQNPDSDLVTGEGDSNPPTVEDEPSGDQSQEDASQTDPSDEDNPDGVTQPENETESETEEVPADGDDTDQPTGDDTNDSLGNEDTENEDASAEDTLDAEELTEEELTETEGEETETIAAEEILLEPRADSVTVQRVGGYAMGGTFFAMGESSYRLVLAEGDDVARLGISEVVYQYGEETGMAAVVGGVVDIPIPETVNEELQVYYYNANEEPVLLFSEYVVNELDAPLINYERVDKNDIQYLHVTMVEQGEVKSGISEAQIMVDGEIAQLPLSNVLKSVELASGQSVPTILEYNVELGSGEEHEFEITACDYAGNMNKKEFSMSAVSTEVVSVVLPTTFKINILPYEEDWQVIGEDITICNCSDFPINVSIDRTYVEVNKIPTDVKFVEQQLDISADDSEQCYDLNEYTTGEKNCDLRLDLALNGEQTLSYAIPEGNGEFLTSFELAQHMEDTDVEELKQMAYEREVTSLDYACVRLRGYLEKGSEALWAGGDLRVTLVFNFSKVSPSEEQLDTVDENMILLEEVMDHEIPEPVEQPQQPEPAESKEQTQSDINMDVESQPVDNKENESSQKAAVVGGE